MTRLGVINIHLANASTLSATPPRASVRMSRPKESE